MVPGIAWAGSIIDWECRVAWGGTRVGNVGVRVSTK